MSFNIIGSVHYQDQYGKWFIELNSEMKDKVIRLVPNVKLYKNGVFVKEDRKIVILKPMVKEIDEGIGTKLVETHMNALKNFICEISVKPKKYSFTRDGKKYEGVTLMAHKVIQKK